MSDEEILARLIHDAAVEAETIGEDELERLTTCRLCGGRLLELGRLGPLLWFRCQACGADESRDLR